MLSPRPLASSVLALLGLAATLGFARSASATPSRTISTKQSVGADLLLDELIIEAGGILEVVPLRSKDGTGTIHIRARKITVKQGGVITATKAGHLGVNGADGGAADGSAGGGKRSAIAGHPGGGGGYLGAGASGASDMCVPYPDSTGGAAVAMPPTIPILGSAGGAANGTSMAGAGGDGGGVILLEAAEIVIDGTVEARGGSPTQASGVAPGGGSGGLIAITAARVIGSGVISVAGGNGPTAPGTGSIKANNGGGGAGGVILIKAREVEQAIQDKLEVQGGSTGSCPTALAGAAGATDVDVTDATFCVDVDGDGAFSTACDGKDCDDSDEAIKPAAHEVCNDADDNCNGVKDEGDDLCPAGSTCNAAAKMCVDLSDGGSDGGPTVDPGAPPDHIAFESGCSFRGGSAGPGAIVLAALGLGALVTRRRRASCREKACK